MLSFPSPRLAPPRRALALLTSAGLLAVAGGALVAAPAQADPVSTTLDYSCTGGARAWVVPPGVTSATFLLDGASGGQGGGDGTPAAGGKGGELKATLAVTPGDAYTVMVGCHGADRGAGGFNGGGAGGTGLSASQGGGGGGATDVRRGGTGTADRVLVAGGGGGSSASGYIPAPSHADPASAGGKGSGEGAGATEGGGDSGHTGGGQPGATNGAGPGGNGINGSATSHGQDGGEGTGGAGGGSLVGGGGGGGGWFGGGGGAAASDNQSAGGGGGGGSGHAADGAAGVTTATGVHSGDGSLTISFTQPVQQPSAPTITGTPPDGAVGSSYSFAFPVSGSPTCSVPSGNLPPGLQVDPASCVLSGTPTAGGVYSFAVTASNGVDPAASVDATVTVTQLGSMHDGVQLQAYAGQSFSAQLPLIGYPAPTVTVRPLTPLPAGLSMGEHGLITGTPTATTPFPLFISLLLDNSSGEGYGGFTISVDDPPAVPASMTSGAPADAVAGQAYSFTFTASGTPSPSFRLAAGQLPNGLALDAASGVLSGTTTDVGDFPITVGASNGAGSEDQRSYTLHVTGTAPSISGSPGSGKVGQPYDASYLLAGYPAPTTTVTAGSLPAGVHLGSDGHLTGTPSAAGSYVFTVTATSSAGTATTDSTITVTAAPSISGAPPAGLVGQTYDFDYSLGGSPTPTTTVTAGSLPAGLQLGSDGHLTGTPSAAGSYVFTVTATSSAGTASTDSTISVTAPAAISGTPGGGVVGQPYDFQYLLGGSPAPTATVTAGSLPAGLQLASDGHLTGTPTTVGTYTFTVAADNAGGPADTVTSTVAVTSPTTRPAIGGTPPNAGVSEPYAFVFTTTGTPRPTVTKSAGSLPPGLTLSASGRLSGTPTSAGTYRFTLRAANGVGSPATQAVVLKVLPLPTLSIGNASVREGGSGTTAMTFRVTMSRPSSVPVAVQWSTANGTAKSGSDYVAATCVLVIAPGHTTGTVTVLVKGDRSREANETLTVHLAHPYRASLNQGTATGTVVNDD